MMRVIKFVLLTGWLSMAACGSDDNKSACDKLNACKLTSSGFSCDNDKAGACSNCLNDSSCADIAAGHCAPACPGAEFKPK
jgi:hypothetical protein